MLKLFIVPRKARNDYISFFILGSYISLSAHSLWRVWFSTTPGNSFIENGLLVHLKLHFPFSLRFSFLHMYGILCSALSWSVQLVPYLKTNILSALQNTFGSSLYLLSIFLWNISPVEADPNGSLKCLYQPNWYANARYDDFSLNFSYCYPELAFMSNRYLTFASLEVCHSPLFPIVLVKLMSGLILLGLDIVIVFHLTWGLAWSSYTFYSIHQLLMVIIV